MAVCRDANKEDTHASPARRSANVGTAEMLLVNSEQALIPSFLAVSIARALHALMKTIYNELTKVQLQARLRRRSIPYAGLKSKEQLVGRLINADADLESKEQLVDRLIEVDVGLLGLQSKELLVDRLREADAGLQRKEQPVDRSKEIGVESISISSNTRRPTAVVPSKGLPKTISTYFGKILSYSFYLLVGIFVITTIFPSIESMSSYTAKSECLWNCVADLIDPVSSNGINAISVSTP
jgi:hypothetical protein